jgi:uncharacterized RDD family membrane protein YckC
MTDFKWTNDQIPLRLEASQRPTAPVRKSGLTPLAGRGSRLVAVLMDIAFFLVACVPGLLFMSDAKTVSSKPLVVDIFVFGPLLLFFLCQITLLSGQGQTMGKKIIGVRIVRYEDEGNPGFWRAVVLRSFVPKLIGVFPLVGKLFSLINILCIFGEERRCIHDHIANTKVVVVLKAAPKPLGRANNLEKTKGLPTKAAA